MLLSHRMALNGACIFNLKVRHPVGNVPFSSCCLLWGLEEESQWSRRVWGEMWVTYTLDLSTVKKSPCPFSPSPWRLRKYSFLPPTSSGFDAGGKESIWRFASHRWRFTCQIKRWSKQERSIRGQRFSLTSLVVFGGVHSPHHGTREGTW